MSIQENTTETKPLEIELYKTYTNRLGGRVKIIAAGQHGPKGSKDLFLGDNKRLYDSTGCIRSVETTHRHLDLVKLSEKQLPDLELGKKYRTRNGRRVTITRALHSDNFQSDYFTIYDRHGRVSLYPIPNDPWDIVDDDVPQIGDILRDAAGMHRLDVAVEKGVNAVELHIEDRTTPIEITLVHHDGSRRTLTITESK